MRREKTTLSPGSSALLFLMSARMKGIFEPSAQAIIPKPLPSIFLTIPTIFTPASEPTADRTSDMESSGRSVRECRFLQANPRPCLNHRSSIYCDRPDLLCVSPHDEHCVWPRSHRNLCHEGVFVFCWPIGVFKFLPTQKRAHP